MQILTIIVPYIKSTSNLALSCHTLHDWLSNNGFPIKTSSGRLSLQNLDYYCSSLLFPDYNICYNAAYNGDIALLKFLQEQGYKWSSLGFYAAKGGQLECLKWLKLCGETFNEDTCSIAARGGHLEVLKWLRKQGCPWTEDICNAAAKGGQLECLKWLREQGCPWDSRACAYAADSCQLECLKWLREKGCPWDMWTYNFALQRGHSEIIKWLGENGAPPEWF